MTSRRSRGFTLIELLVVIAIIAILAGILFPVFAKAREKAFTADCLSNAKQLSLSFKMYLSDWNSRFPSAGNGYSTFNRGSDWVKINNQGTAGDMTVEQGALFPYVKNADVYVCKNALIAAEKSQSNGTRTSYTMNSNLVNNSTWLGIRESRVKFPSQTFLLVEENDDALGFATGQYNDAVFYVPPPPSTSWDTACGNSGSDSERHGGGSIGCFVDGHAKWFPTMDLTPYTAANSPSRLHPWYFPRRSGPDAYP